MGEKSIFYIEKSKKLILFLSFSSSASKQRAKETVKNRKRESETILSLIVVVLCWENNILLLQIFKHKSQISITNVTFFHSLNSLTLFLFLSQTY